MSGVVAEDDIEEPLELAMGWDLAVAGGEVTDEFGGGLQLGDEAGGVPPGGRSLGPR